MNDNRVISANIPSALASQLDEIAERKQRSRSWIVRQALGEWLTEEQRRGLSRFVARELGMARTATYS